MKKTGGSRTLLGFIGAFLILCSGARASSSLPSKEFLLAAVDKNSGEVLWEAYELEQVPEEFRSRVPANFFDRNKSRSSSTDVRKREVPVFRLHYEKAEPGGDAAIDMHLKRRPPKEDKAGQRPPSNIKTLRSVDDLHFVIDAEGTLACFRLGEHDQESGAPEWQTSLVADDFEKEPGKSPLQRHRSDIILENDGKRLFALTPWGITQFSFSGERISDIPSSDRFQFWKGDEMFGPNFNIGTSLSPDTLLVRDQNYFHAVDRKKGTLRWSFRHGYEGSNLTSSLVADSDIVLLEAWDSTPEMLRLTMGMPALFGGATVKRSKDRVASALELMRVCGYRHSKSLLEKWFEQAPLPPKPKLAFGDNDPDQERRNFEEVIPADWMPMIRKILEKPWEPLRDPDKLDRLCLAALQGKPPIDREFALELLFERAYRYPRLVSQGHPQAHTTVGGKVFAAAFRTELNSALKGVLEGEVPQEEANLAMVLSIAPTSKEGGLIKDGLRGYAASPIQSTWLAAIGTIVMTGDRDAAIDLVSERPLEEQLLATPCFCGNGGWNLSPREIQYWQQLFAQAPLKLAGSIGYPINSALMTPVRDFLREESKARSISRKDDVDSLLQLIKVLHSSRKSADTPLIQSFKEHPQARERADGDGYDLGGGDLFSEILKERLGKDPFGETKRSGADDPFDFD